MGMTFARSLAAGIFRVVIYDVGISSGRCLFNGLNTNKFESSLVIFDRSLSKA